MKTFKEYHHLSEKKQDEQIKKRMAQVGQLAKKVTGVELAQKLAAKAKELKKKAMDKLTLKKLRDKLAKMKGDGLGITQAAKDMMEVQEGKMQWNHKVINDGTMGIGIFDSDKEKALEAARQLIIFLRKNKRVKIGGEKEDSDGEPNEAIAKYSEELSKLFFDDQLLDDLEPKGHNSEEKANDIVVKRLRDLGVNIK